MKKSNRGHGFIAPEILPDHYLGGVFSKTPYEVLQKNGQWDEFVPKDETQAKKIETFNCTNYGNLNCIEVLLKRKYEGDYDFSERYTGVLSETTEYGNDPHKVLEVIRKESGLIPESMLAFSDDIDSWNKYYSPKPMTSGLLRIGWKWLEEYTLKHEWVFSGGELKEKQQKMKEALKHSPLGVSVYAWKTRGDLYVKDGEQDNHWTMCYGYKDKKYWKIFDSYDNTRKKLAWSYDFGFCKRYFVEKNNSSSQLSSFFNFIKTFILGIF